MNTDPLDAHDCTFTLEEIGLPAGVSTARNLWVQQTSYCTNALTVTVSAGDIVMFKLSAGMAPGSPALSVQTGSNGVRISWTTNSSGYFLEATRDILTPAWTKVPGQAEVIQCSNVVVIGDVAETRFFRPRRYQDSSLHHAGLRWSMVLQDSRIATATACC
jgi:hypothetical protein